MSYKSLSKDRLYLYYTISPTFCQELKKLRPTEAPRRFHTHGKLYFYTPIGMYPPSASFRLSPSGTRGGGRKCGRGSGWAREARGDKRSSSTSQIKVRAKTKATRLLSCPLQLIKMKICEANQPYFFTITSYFLLKIPYTRYQ